ncbi:MAG: AAA family ATPase, partial [Planctomycetales bacterium]
RSFAFNATNLLRVTRQRWLGLFAEYNARIEIVYVEPPFPLLLAQNKRREHPVPEKVIRDLGEKYEPPTWREAHAVRFVDGPAKENLGR